VLLVSIHRSFGAFLGLIGVIAGVIAVQYWGDLFTTLPKQAFSTEEIAKAKRLNRVLQRKELYNSDLEMEIALLNRQILNRTPPSEVAQSANKSGASLSTIPVGDPRLERLSGVTPVSGEGLEIVVTDSKQPVSYGPTHLVENPNLGIVHNVDLMMLVNQLWASGAQAIAINQQRIVAQSQISCAGPIVMINKTRIGSPFRIQVIGPVHRMTTALEGKNSYLKYLASYGVPAQVAVTQLKLPAYTLDGSLE
jgi:uncharacterized protein YlxW (UPF0749 family)